MGRSDSEHELPSRQRTHRQASSRSRQRAREAGRMRLPEACASGDEESEPIASDALSVREIKAQLTRLSVGFADCIDKAELNQRLEEAKRGAAGAGRCSSTALIVATGPDEDFEIAD